MKSENIIVSESDTQNDTTLDDKHRDFYTEKSDIEGRLVTYIFAIIVVLGFASMVAMGIFAFVL